MASTKLLPNGRSIPFAVASAKGWASGQFLSNNYKNLPNGRNIDLFDPIFDVPGGVMNLCAQTSERTLTNVGIQSPDSIATSAWTRADLTPIDSTTLEVSNAAPVLSQAIFGGVGNVPGIPLLHCYDFEYISIPWICVETRTGQATNRTWFNIQTATVGTTGTANTSPTISVVSGSRTRITILVTSNSSNGQTIRIIPVTGDNVLTAPAVGTRFSVRENASFKGWVDQQRTYGVCDRYTAYTDPDNAIWYVQDGNTNVQQPSYGPIQFYSGQADINGLPAFRANAAGFLYAAHPGVNALFSGAHKASTIFVVMRFFVDDLDSAYFGVGNSGTTAGRGYGSSISGNGRYSVTNIDDTGTAVSVTATADIANDQLPKIWSIVDTGASSANFTWRENGAVIPSLNGVTFNPGNTTVNRSSMFRLTSSALASPPQGVCGEILVYNVALSGADITSIEASLNVKWGGIF